MKQQPVSQVLGLRLGKLLDVSILHFLHPSKKKLDQIIPRSPSLGGQGVGVEDCVKPQSCPLIRTME